MCGQPVLQIVSQLVRVRSVASGVTIRFQTVLILASGLPVIVCTPRSAAKVSSEGHIDRARARERARQRVDRRARVRRAAHSIIAFSVDLVEILARCVRTGTVRKLGKRREK